MKQYAVKQCKACAPVNRLLNQLTARHFTIVEKTLRDYHFSELYFKLTGDLTTLGEINTKGFTVNGNVYTCACHWSGVEVVAPSNG